MNVKRIVLKAGEELPEVCWECEACQGISPDYLYCMGKHIDIDAHNTRPSWCPLQVEEVCEWVLDYHMDDAMWDIAPSCCVGEFSMNKPKYEVCPSCGKRIKYVESEE